MVSGLQHLIMTHTARRQIGAANVGQSRFRAGVLLGVVIFPFDIHRAIITDAVQLDHDLLDAIGVPGRTCGDEVPTVQAASHRPVPAQQAGARVFAKDLHPLDVGTMDAVAELADELDDRNALPLHVRAVEIETGDLGVAGLVQGCQVITGGLNIAHGSFTGMALQIEGDAILFAGVEYWLETFDQQLEADLADIGDSMAANAGRQWREEEEVAPAVSRRAHEARYRYLAVLEFAEKMGQTDGVDEILRSLVVNGVADLLRHVVGIGSRRLIPFFPPGLVSGDGFTADQLERFGTWLIAERLALQVGGDGEDLQSVLLGQLDPLPPVGFRAGIAATAA
jgi:hypothetical protein